MSDHELDARNMLCPMPVIRTQDRIAKLQAGETLKVFCTDPGALQDIPAWCRINGHEVLETTEHGDDVIVVVRVGSD